jgi:hypothetical protein
MVGKKVEEACTPGGGEGVGNIALNNNKRKRKTKGEGLDMEGTANRKKRRQVVLQKGDDNYDLAVAFKLELPGAWEPSDSSRP